MPPTGVQAPYKTSTQPSTPAHDISGPSRPFPIQAQEAAPAQAEQTGHFGHRFGDLAASSKDLQPRGAGRPLPEPVRSKMEHALGTDFSDVRIHQDDNPASIGATAYAQGHNIHFRPGKFQPNSRAGQRLIGHELTHVVQQRARRVTAPQGKRAPINSHTGLEREADILGEMAGTTDSRAPSQAGGHEGSPRETTTSHARSRTSTPEHQIFRDHHRQVEDNPYERSRETPRGKMESDSHGRNTRPAPAASRASELSGAGEPARPRSAHEAITPTSPVVQCNGLLSAAARKVPVLGVHLHKQDAKNHAKRRDAALEIAGHTHGNQALKNTALAMADHYQREHKKSSRMAKIGTVATPAHLIAPHVAGSAIDLVAHGAGMATELASTAGPHGPTHTFEHAKSAADSLAENQQIAPSHRLFATVLSGMANGIGTPSQALDASARTDAHDVGDEKFNSDHKHDGFDTLGRVTPRPRPDGGGGGSA